MNVDIKEVAEVAGNLVIILNAGWAPPLNIGSGQLEKTHSDCIGIFWPLIDIDQFKSSLAKLNKAAVVKDYLLSKYSEELTNEEADASAYRSYRAARDWDNYYGFLQKTGRISRER